MMSLSGCLSYMYIVEMHTCRTLEVLLNFGALARYISVPMSVDNESESRSQAILFDLIRHALRFNLRPGRDSIELAVALLLTYLSTMSIPREMYICVTMLPRVFDMEAKLAAKTCRTNHCLRFLTGCCSTSASSSSSSAQSVHLMSSDPASSLTSQNVVE